MAWYLKVLLIPTIYPPVLSEQFSMEKKKKKNEYPRLTSVFGKAND